MSEIHDAKVQFKTDLAAAGLHVLEYVPERIVPPVVIVNAASPYIQKAEFGNEYTLGIELVLIAATATNKQATLNLDQLVENVLNAIEPITYARFTTVNQPYNLQTNNAEYLATNVYVQLAITI